MHASVTIKNSMPDPLTDEESLLFERMHESQPYYGNLPLALLAERAGFLQRAVLAIWDEPNDCEHIRVLHKLLAYYADGAPKRRRADRQSKQRSQAGSSTSLEDAGTLGQAEEADADGDEADPRADNVRHASSDHHGGSVQLIENLHSPQRSEEDPFAQVSEHLRELYGITCDADCETWEYHLRSESQNSVTIGMRCECGCVARSIEILRHEFETRAGEVLQWTKSPPVDTSENAGRPSGES